MDSRIEAVAESYVSRAHGNPSLALRIAVADAMADLDEAERRALNHEALISLDYIRGRCDAPTADPDLAEALLGGYGR